MRLEGVGVVEPRWVLGGEPSAVGREALYRRQRLVRWATGAAAASRVSLAASPFGLLGKKGKISLLVPGKFPL